MMKTLIILGVAFAACLIFVPSAHAAPLFIQTATGTETTGTGFFLSNAFASSTTGGHTIILTVVNDSAVIGTTQNVTDTAKDPFIKIKDVISGTDLTIWYATSTTTQAGNKIGVTYNSANTSNASVVAQEFSGIFVPTPLDQSATSSALGVASTSISIGPTATTTQASELVVGAMGYNVTSTTITAGAGFSNLGQVFITGASTGQESEVVTTTAKQSAKFSLSQARVWTGEIATFKAAAAVNTQPTPEYDFASGFFQWIGNFIFR